MRRQSPRASARSDVMKMIESAQKVSRRWRLGSATSVNVTPRKSTQLPTVTRWNTLTRSSAVEWSVRSSSLE